MKKSLVALALMGAFAGAQAQSSVTIYGTVDAGISKTTGTTAQIGKRDNNKLGFRGVEDLGNGLKALFHLEIRYEPDTGTIEGVTRPLFQGQSRVGLQGGFGTVRLGRGLTAFQESITAFEPWNGLPAVAGFQTNLQVAGYTSDPLSPAGNSGNRFSNGVWYNSPVWGGFQFNGTFGTKDANGGPAVIGRGTALAPQYAANAQASAHPYSVSVTYNNGPFAAMAATERNAIETKLWSVAASYKPTTALKLMASYQQQDQDHTLRVNPETDAWVIGANYTMGPGKVLVGYGQKHPDGVLKTKEISLGYEYSLSARTYVYVDVSNRKLPVPVTAASDSSLNHYSLGIHHNF
ncbi:porin [Pseudoduganella namucuonensis]|uniref:Outer membrane protein (Porin) n=1 Tax=Pseudoduganella namucuonensis TaxID=1035707 RepID=A0A1I7LKD7_9BURK|nr:porin [Pseudoduganella namucuonensis]SFV10182.1 Outer membrane protein (porin) [Pseudoduganella namucuonensis]